MMRRPNNSLIHHISMIGLGALLSLAGCTITAPAPAPEPIRMFSSDHFYPRVDQPQCKMLLDTYCNYLYSPDVLGNLEIVNGEGSMKILQGETRNQFSQVFYRYSRAKIRNQASLPRDFVRALTRANYFQKLDAFLTRKPRQSMSLADRLQVEQQNFELGSIWGAATNETILLRMNERFPGSHQIPDKLIPIELDLEKRRIRRTLISEISRAIWTDDANWQKVEETFDRLRNSYLHILRSLDIDDKVRADWIQRISEVKLVLPGATPALSNEECSTTTANAYYYTHLNVITVCAGDFNSEDALQTLAHEMGHALGIERARYLFQAKSTFGQRLSQFRTQICEPQEFSCEVWTKFKDDYEGLLQSLKGYQTELPEFQRCLKRRPTSKPINNEDILRFAGSIVTDRISELASSDRFLRITKAEIPMRNGKTQINPNYLNPCNYYLWSEGEEPIDEELSTLMFFTAEYRCSDTPPTTKLKTAIEKSKEMTRKLLEQTLAQEGEFSDRNELENEGYSSPPGERFADVIGSYAMADYLEKLPSRSDRRNQFLAGTSWLCLEPSLASHFPDENSVEKEYVFDSHTEGDQRRKELFSTPIRKAIGCEKDFEFNECSLPFKK